MLTRLCAAPSVNQCAILFSNTSTVRSESYESIILAFLFEILYSSLVSTPTIWFCSIFLLVYLVSSRHFGMPWSLFASAPLGSDSSLCLSCRSCASTFARGAE